jgi:hypothetical protein
VKKFPETVKEFQEARNAGLTCRHKLAGLATLQDQSDPSPQDMGRLKRTLYCEACGAIKYARVQSNGIMRSWK